MKTVLLYFLISPFLWAKNNEIKCPEGTTKVQFKSPISSEVHKFCQIYYKGKLVKHGPFLKLSESGLVLDELYYNKGVKGQKPTPIKKEVSKKSAQEQMLDELYAFTFGRAFEVSQKEAEFTIAGQDNGRCLVNPMKRLMFITKNIPFTEPRKFRKACNLQGSLRFELNKKQKAVFLIKRLMDFSNFTFEYTMTKETLSPTKVRLTILMKRGRFDNPDKSNTVEFESELRILADLQQVMALKGRGGIFVEGGSFKVLRVNGKKVAYKKEKL